MGAGPFTAVFDDPVALRRSAGRGVGSKARFTAAFAFDVGAAVSFAFAAGAGFLAAGFFAAGFFSTTLFFAALAGVRFTRR
jgi:hypothetical protein